LTEEIIVTGYSLPINLEYKDAIKVDWLVNPKAIRISSAVIEFHPYFVFEYSLDVTRKDPTGGTHHIKDRGIHIVDASNGRFLFPPRQFEYIPFRVLDRITKTKRIENLDLITNAEITQTIMDLKTFGAVPNNKIILNGDYEVGIIGDEISIKMAERKVLKKVVSDGTQKVSYYTSSGKAKKKEQKIEITPRLSEVRINRKPDGLIYVPKWIITIKAGEHTYKRKALAASNTFILDEIAFCPNHSALGKIWSRPKQTSAVCEICGGTFCDDHIFKINNTYYCEKDRPNNTYDFKSKKIMKRE
jgi:hypothetical protein